MTLYVLASLVNDKLPEDRDFACVFSEPLIPTACLRAAPCWFTGASPPPVVLGTRAAACPQGRLQTVAAGLFLTLPSPTRRESFSEDPAMSMSNSVFLICSFILKQRKTIREIV